MNLKWKYFQKLREHSSVKVMVKIEKIKLYILKILSIFQNKNRNKLNFSKTYLQLKY